MLPLDWFSSFFKLLSCWRFWVHTHTMSIPWEPTAFNNKTAWFILCEVVQLLVCYVTCIFDSEVIPALSSRQRVHVAVYLWLSCCVAVCLLLCQTRFRLICICARSYFLLWVMYQERCIRLLFVYLHARYKVSRLHKMFRNVNNNKMISTNGIHFKLVQMPTYGKTDHSNCCYCCCCRLLSRSQVLSQQPGNILR